MQHRYIDTSDLNAPYDQYRSARPLQGIGAATHLYQDYSDLNAQYDRQRPAIHGLGGGSLGGNALGTGVGSGVEQGIGESTDKCGLLSSGHGRMLRKLAAMPGDVELIASFERLTGLYGCPMRGENHWFWTTAPTSAWIRRGSTNEFVERDWQKTLSGEWTWFIPPYVQDMGEAYDTRVALREQLDDGPHYMVSDLQQALNAELAKLGCQSIGVDNDLGPQTCGALAKVKKDGSWWRDEATVAIEMCDSFNYQCQPGAAPVTKPPAKRKSGPSTDTYLIGGAVVAAVLLIGGAYYYRSM